MKVLIRKTSLRLLVRRVLQWTQRVLFAGAILMLGYCGFVLTDTWMFQRRETQDLERMLQDQRPATNGVLQARARTPRASRVKSTSRPALGDFDNDVPGGLIGRIEIPRLGVSVVVVEDTGASTLRRAAGHITGTALPGEPGNVGIAGHRDTFFRPLRNIRRNDVITVTTVRGEYRYRVVSTKVVSPDDVAVLNPDGDEILTLVTCYPFYFVGSAPRRFIVRAERIT
jgi:sortase A